MSKLVIGLTGGIASGKTTVSDLFAKLGIDIIDADVIAREVVAKGTPGLAAIVEKFGDNILTPDLELDRQKLRTIVFSDNAKKDWLNALLHPLIREQMQLQTASATSPYCILSVPLLVENKLNAMVSRTLVVDIDEASQIKRAVARDNSEQAIIESIIASQASRTQRLAAADDVIVNNKDLEWLSAQVQDLHQMYLNIVNKNL
ncbi:dephospho-CoA kinase [Brumicola nitratireducens]|uniref:Dephospho-CoA kinase n=1 Tax=Glaciecola nitratireducens (strain JCM 12485 / KCTC 12276 / FR1064) TaxID=1085623 RepID=G4QMC5_GLANF|nr:dephospho-CoA kinase [Glaciecola nitratireducens]AEP30777.1 dephospho-CoA kinase [Glaciecola nitratireducens FR1064]